MRLIQWYKKLIGSCVTTINLLRCQPTFVVISRNMVTHISYYYDYYYVNDMLIVSVCKLEIDKLKGELSKELAMKDVAATKPILGMRITIDKGR